VTAPPPPHLHSHSIILGKEKQKIEKSDPSSPCDSIHSHSISLRPGFSTLSQDDENKAMIKCLGEASLPHESALLLGGGQKPVGFFKMSKNN
jgi:hypothetical protein